MNQNDLFTSARDKGMYDPSFEHDNCGIGAVVNIKGKKTHQTVENALKIVENLEHRAGKDAERSSPSVFFWVPNGNTELECFSFLRMN